MVSEIQSLSFRVIVDASPEAAYFMFTNAGGYRSWLCAQSQVDPRPGGRLYLWWRSGYYVCGTYNTLESNRALAFTWYGREEPWETQVQVVFSPTSGGTQIELKHFGMGTGDGWEEVSVEFKKGWEKGLENLQSVVESGQDLRIVRRPVLGVQIGRVLTTAETRALNLPYEGAILVDAAVAGTGAASGGIQRGDLLTSLGGLPVPTIEDLSQALDRYFAGDRVELGLVRDGKELTVEMDLSSRTLPTVPREPAAFADAVQETNRAAYQEVRAFLDEVSEDQADMRPHSAEWNVRQNLAHLIVVERDTQGWIAAAVSDREVVFNTNEVTRLDALIKVYPTLPELLAEFKRAQEETVGMIRALPKAFVQHRKGSYVNLGNGLLTASLHLRGHLEQMARLIDT